MKQELLNPLSYSSPNYDEAIQENFKPHWIIGIDPTLSGALAVLKFDDKGSCSAQVYDTPRRQVVVQNIPRSRFKEKSMLELIRTLDVPSGTKAFVAKMILYEDDNIMAAYNAGLGYGLWTGILLTSNISVSSVAPSTWKKHFKLSIYSRDGGRKLALKMFPSLSSQLTRRRDYARANALLIAAYGHATSETKYYSFSQI
ncbi:unnamed protein product [Arabidopsis lyrata]|uniref:Uncharacterized protein n=2 Tax=Arabidopsis lyrata subsp. lyrata TaxID=81972 RepID=D7LME8_ARALL|nr:hypothetical protein ARALYDRAFT_484823 [Arabidopsis lyrata subsp. lyrata]CAH8267340.1 unnamed protein product [Arabidopsis lyrata]